MNQDPPTTESWQPVPLSYHLDTIGIGEVYVTPPPGHLMYKPIHTTKEHEEEVESKSLGQEDVAVDVVDDDDRDDKVEKESPSTTIFKSWEMIGSIKSCPQDFVVKEIGSCKIHQNEKKNTALSTTTVTTSNSTSSFQNGKVATLTDTTTLPPVREQKVEDSSCSTTHQRKESIKEHIEDDDNHNDALKDHYSRQKRKIKYVNSLKEVIQCILSDCVHSKNDHTTTVSSTVYKDLGTFEHIEKLYSNAMNNMISRCEDKASQSSSTSSSSSSSKSTTKGLNKANNVVILPPINDDFIILPQNNDTTTKNSNDTIKANSVGEFHNRSTFHQALKLVFPLLSSSNLSHKEMIEMTESSSNNENHSKPKGSYIKVVQDSLFDSIAPYLSHVEDLVSLYKFRNRGCFESTGPSMRKRGGRKNRKTNKGDRARNNDRSCHNIDHDNNHDDALPTEVYLRLKPEIAKERRREIHHLISQTCRDFETGTTNNFRINGVEVKGTTAIAICWSQRAQRKLHTKKRKRCDDDTNKDNLTNTLCIVKKTNQEHMAMIQYLTAALKCSQTDIGLAGIKDMCAVTHQYCTLRNILPRRAQKANEILKLQNIELGDFERVNWFLQTGMHQGNQFEIVVRNVQRVIFRKHNEENIEEKYIPCESSHIDDMVEHIRQDGFINFFGEQRVGNAGQREEVGVRPFNIGRSMLKGNFTEAIDLLMTGRHMFKGEYLEGENQRKVRKIWKETGDPNATLAAFPNGKLMTRERTVLKGLKRYSKDKPLESLQCLPYSVRMFWINAYQSYVWNHMATQRMLLGKRPLVGDLYVESDQNNEIKVVTNTSAVSFAQIVLPLPGYNVQYPENCIGQKYKKFLMDDLGYEIIKKNPIQESSAKGSYRKLAVIPKDITWHRVNDDEEGNDTISAVRFNFSLPAGSYATMLLRELMTSPLAR